MQPDSVIKSISSFRVSNRRFFVRSDLNAPIFDGQVNDMTRLKAALPTLKLILEGGGSVVLGSHLGRPSGMGYEKHLSMSPIFEELRKLLPSTKIYFDRGNVCNQELLTVARSLRAGELLLLENLRFYEGEKTGDSFFAEELCQFADHYVNDAFGTIHREDCSIVCLPNAFRKKGSACLAGFLMDQELSYFLGSLKKPKSPFISIVGGAKVSDKLKVIKSLLEKSDRVLIGGAMSYTFLAAQGKKVGKSLVQSDYLQDARGILEDAGARLLLPKDHFCGDNIDSKKGFVYEHIPSEMLGLDIGSSTVSLYKEVIQLAQTIIWNGPMGRFEQPPFDKGTNEIGEAIARATDRGATTIVGGGDSVAALERAGLASKVSHLSTGGGASLAMLEGRELLGLKALDYA